jgi:hypothetical protein
MAKKGMCILKGERLFIIHPATAAHRKTECLMVEPVSQCPAFFSFGKDILACIANFLTLCLATVDSGTTSIIITFQNYAIFFFKGMA